MLQKAINDTIASEAAKHSTQEICKASSPPTPKKAITVHHDDICSDEASSRKDEDVHRVKLKCGKFKKWSEDQPECASCRGNQTHLKCCHLSALLQKGAHCERKLYAVTKCHCSTEATIAQAYRKLHVIIQIEGAPCNMEVDSGSAMSIVSRSTILKHWLQSSHPVHLRDSQGNSIPVVGIGRFQVAFKNFKGPLRLVVVEGPRTSLLGLDWFALGINSISNPDAESLEKDFADMFNGTLGQYAGTPHQFNLDPQITPIKLQPRCVCFALKPKVVEQLDKLIVQNILEPVDHTRWGTPIVMPIKLDRSVRICADYICNQQGTSTRHFNQCPL